jgi:hypothetical protein
VCLGSEEERHEEADAMELGRLVMLKGCLFSEKQRPSGSWLSELSEKAAE